MLIFTHPLAEKGLVILLGTERGSEIAWYWPTGIMSRYTNDPANSQQLMLVLLYLGIFVGLSWAAAPSLVRIKKA